MTKTHLIRCEWAQTDDTLMQYHDQEWGKPNFDNRDLFELFCLELMQAGLSWKTVLYKRKAFKQAFADFNVTEVQHMDSKVSELMTNKGIIRNRRKILAIIQNAKAVVALETQGQSFSDYVWQFVDHQPVIHYFQNINDVPGTTELAKIMSKQMKQDGFAFAGPVIVYSFMQAAGLVNDHITSCFAWQRDQIK